MKRIYAHILLLVVFITSLGVAGIAAVQNPFATGYITTDVYNSDGAELSIYPNPVKAFATISFSKNIDRIVVLNIVGKEITAFIPEQGKTVISVNLSELQPGVYFIAGMSNGTKMITKRFMKEI